MTWDFVFGVGIGIIFSLAIYVFMLSLKKEQVQEEKKDPADWWKRGEKPYED
jgi:uncharacterized membrane protein YdjX (TVP38/TMEM64 family)